MKTEAKPSGQVPGGDTFDPDLEEWLICGGATMGERGTLAGTINALQLGGHPGGVPNVDLYSDAQVGWGRTVVGLVERHRWLGEAWFALSHETQATLLLCYSAPPARFRTDQGFGAKDSSPTVEDITKHGAHEPQRGSHESIRTGVEAQFGRLASLAFNVTDDPVKLLRACQDAQQGSSTLVKKKGTNSKIITRDRDKALERARTAHAEWFESKAGATPPRRTTERRAVLPAVVGGDE